MSITAGGRLHGPGSLRACRQGRADAGAGGCGEADEHQWAGRGASVGVEAKNEYHEHQQRWAEGKADQ